MKLENVIRALAGTMILASLALAALCLIALRRPRRA